MLHHGLEIGLGDLQPVAIDFGGDQTAGARRLDNILEQEASLVRLSAAEQQKAIAGSRLETRIVLTQFLILLLSLGDPPLCLKGSGIEQMRFLVLKLRMSLAKAVERSLRGLAVARAELRAGEPE